MFIKFIGAVDFFLFSKDDYKNAILGAYNFSFMPITIPARHEDPLQLRATAEHEQIHDMLARQTTHGYAALFTNVYLSKNYTPENAPPVIVDALTQVLENGRALHERYATFGTLYTSRQYEALIQRLPEDYQTYFREAKQMIPKGLEEKRIGRVFVYAAVLAGLNPPLTYPQGDEESETLILQMLQQIGNCEKRWEKIIKWKIRNEEEIIVAIDSLMQKANYDLLEKDLPVYFSESFPRLGNDNQRYDNFLDKERLLVAYLLELIGSAALPQNELPIALPKLRSLVTAYRDRLVPGFRLAAILTEIYEVDENTYGDLHRLFMDKPILDTTPFKKATSLGKKPEAVIRILDYFFKHAPNASCIGYLSDRIGEGLKERFAREIDRALDLSIEWYFINNQLDLHRSDPINGLYLFHLSKFLEQFPAQFPLEQIAVLTAPGEIHRNPELKNIALQFAAQGISWTLAFC